jgi:hypothetical protein
MFGAESTPRFVNGVLGTLVSREADLRSILHPMSMTDDHE